jgi:hypothetical protein
MKTSYFHTKNACPGLTRKETIVSEEPLTLDLNLTAQILGVEPKQDPVTGRWFYLWDDMFAVDDKGRPVPSFGAQETSKIFFGRGPDWLRWRYHPTENYPNGYFVLDNVILEPKRSDSGQRFYTLADIERMAHALAENDAIDGARLMSVISIALHVARLYGYV